MAKKRNPQDLTLRNLHALKTKVAKLSVRVAKLEKRVRGKGASV